MQIVHTLTNNIPIYTTYEELSEHFRTMFDGAFESTDAAYHYEPESFTIPIIEIAGIYNGPSNGIDDDTRHIVYFPKSYYTAKWKIIQVYKGAEFSIINTPEFGMKRKIMGYIVPDNLSMAKIFDAIHHAFGIGCIGE